MSELTRFGLMGAAYGGITPGSSATKPPMKIPKATYRVLRHQVKQEGAVLMKSAGDISS